MSSLPSTPTAAVSARSEAIFAEELRAQRAFTDRLFAALMAIQLVVSIILAVTVSPRTWIGDEPYAHIHVWVACIAGTLIASLPILLSLLRPSELSTRLTTAAAQMFFSALLIHVTGGRIESHFHIFGSLALLAFYRDWKVIILATCVTAADHFARGVFWPQSVFGIASPGSFRWIEHTAWVLFQDTFLLISIRHSLRASWISAEREAKVRYARDLAQQEVEARTSELKASERFLRAVLDGQTAHIAILDSTGHIVATNLAWRQFWAENCGEEYPIDASFNYLAVCDSAAGQSAEESHAVAAAIRRVLQGESEESCITYPCHSATRNRWFKVAITPVGNDVPGVVVSHYDISDQITAQQELNLLAQQAQQASLAKSEFLANMSHEIRTPMTAILGYAELLEAKKTLNQEELERQVHATETIQRNGNHLLEIINNVLDVSKIESGKVKLECVEFDLPRFVEETAALVHQRALAKQLELNVSMLPPLPRTLTSDPTRIRQILLNLIGNAIKFTETGSVTIEVSYEQYQLHIAVSDTGIGMTPAQLHHINHFSPFNQADTSVTRKHGGSGLGLHISNSLVKLLGGSLDLTARDGQGTTAKLTIPIDPANPELLTSSDQIKTALKSTSPSPLPLSGNQTPETERLAGIRVLLVEDGVDNQRLVSLLLRKAGALVNVVENGQLAIDEALATHEGESPYDVILMDMQMPVKDGYTATSELRDAGYTGPIVALTAHAMASDRKKCLDAGCSDYLVKPIERSALIEIVQNWSLRACEF